MTRTAVPTDAVELEDLLADSEAIQELVKDPKQFKDLITNYARTVTNKDAGLGQQVKEQVQKELATWLEENGVKAVNGLLDLRPEGAGISTAHRAAGYNPEAVGAPLDKAYAGSVDFLRSIWHGNKSSANAERLERIRNDYSSEVPADGGFLVPEFLRSTLLALSLESGIVRPRAMVIPMENPRVPFPTLDSTTNVGSVYGGLIASWTEESAQLNETDAKFGRVVLDAKKLTGYSQVPNELFADSIISFEAFLAQRWPEALAFFEDIAFFRGTGVGEPLGFLNANASVSSAAVASQITNTIVWENIVAMYARMLPTSLGKAVWVANINTFPELATMALSVGTGGSAIWLNNGSEGPPMTILGRPVVFTEKAETLGTAGDINFVDLSYYLIGDRQQMTMTTSPHYKFQNDQTAVRIIQRVDGRPWLQSAITPNKGANTLSAFVKLATRP